MGRPRRAARYEMRGPTSLAAARRPPKPPSPLTAEVSVSPTSSSDHHPPFSKALSALRMEGAHELGQTAEREPRAAGTKPEAQPSWSPEGASHPGWGGSGDGSSCWRPLDGTAQLGLRTAGEFWVSKFEEEDGEVHLHFFVQPSRLFTVGLVPQCAVKCRIKYENVSKSAQGQEESPSVRLRPGREKTGDLACLGMARWRLGAKRSQCGEWGRMPERGEALVKPSEEPLERCKLGGGRPRAVAWGHLGRKTWSPCQALLRGRGS